MIKILNKFLWLFGCKVTNEVSYSVTCAHPMDISFMENGGASIRMQIERAEYKSQWCLTIWGKRFNLKNPKITTTNVQNVFADVQTKSSPKVWSASGSIKYTNEDFKDIIDTINKL